MTIIWLLISIVFGLLIKKVAYGLITEQSMLRQSFWMTVNEMRERQHQIEFVFIQSIVTSIFLLLFYQKGVNLELLKFAFFTIMVVLIGYVDFKTTFVYRLTTFITFVGGLLFIFLESIQLKLWPIDSIAGFLIGFIVIGLIVVLTRGMGEGDIEIASLCGLFLGTAGSILTLFLGIILGGIAGATLLMKQKKGLKDEMAFGPYLVAGALISMLWGDTLLQWYLSLF